MKKQTQTFIMALVFVVSILALLFVIVLLEIGGKEALFLIIGHVAAWVEIITIYYFRKKPKDENGGSG